VPKGIIKLIFLHPTYGVRSDDSQRNNLGESLSRSLRLSLPPYRFLEREIILQTSLVQISKVCAHYPFIVLLFYHHYIRLPSWVLDFAYETFIQ
jgi:hypothetical protein